MAFEHYSDLFKSGLLSECTSPIDPLQPWAFDNMGRRRSSLPEDVQPVASSSSQPDQHHHLELPHEAESSIASGESLYFTFKKRRDPSEFRSFLSLDLAESQSLRSASLKNKASQDMLSFTSPSRHQIRTSRRSMSTFPSFMAAYSPPQQPSSPQRSSVSFRSLSIGSAIPFPFLSMSPPSPLKALTFLHAPVPRRPNNSNINANGIGILNSNANISTTTTATATTNISNTTMNTASLTVPTVVQPRSSPPGATAGGKRELSPMLFASPPPSPPLRSFMDDLSSVRLSGVLSRTSTISTGYRRAQRGDALAALEGRGTGQQGRRCAPVAHNFMSMSDDEDEDEVDEVLLGDATLTGGKKGFDVIMEDAMEEDEQPLGGIRKQGLVSSSSPATRARGLMASVNDGPWYTLSPNQDPWPMLFDDGYTDVDVDVDADGLSKLSPSDAHSHHSSSSHGSLSFRRQSSARLSKRSKYSTSPSRERGRDKLMEVTNTSVNSSSSNPTSNSNSNSATPQSSKRRSLLLPFRPTQPSSTLALSPASASALSSPSAYSSSSALTSSTKPHHHQLHPHSHAHSTPSSRPHSSSHLLITNTSASTSVSASAASSSNLYSSSSGGRPRSTPSSLAASLASNSNANTNSTSNAKSRSGSGSGVGSAGDNQKKSKHPQQHQQKLQKQRHADNIAAAASSRQQQQRSSFFTTNRSMKGGATPPMQMPPRLELNLEWLSSRKDVTLAHVAANFIDMHDGDNDVEVDGGEGGEKDLDEKASDSWRSIFEVSCNA